MGVAPNGQSSVSTASDVAFTASPSTGQFLQYDAVGKWKNKNLHTATTKTANYTAVNGEFVICNASSGAITITLPDASVAKTGGTVRVIKSDSSTNAVTVRPATGTLNNVAGPSGATNTVSRTTDYTAANLDVVQCNASSGSLTVTLPSPVNGAWVRIVKTDSSVNGALVKPPSGTIDGDISCAVNRQYIGQNFVGDGSAWHYVSESSFETRLQGTAQDFMTDGTYWYLA